MRFAKQNDIDLTVVAPDDPLAMGMVDALQAEGTQGIWPHKGCRHDRNGKVFARTLCRSTAFLLPNTGFSIVTIKRRIREGDRVSCRHKGRGLGLGERCGNCRGL